MGPGSVVVESGPKDVNGGFTRGTDRGKGWNRESQIRVVPSVSPGKILDSSTVKRQLIGDYGGEEEPHFQIQECYRTLC